MKPFIKTGKGVGSWTTTIAVLFVMLFILMYLTGVFTPVDWIRFESQKAWGSLEPILLYVLGTYLFRRAQSEMTGVYERVQNGASTGKEVMALLNKNDEPTEEKTEQKE